MKEYIERDAVREAMLPLTNGNPVLWSNIKRAISAIPAADVVPVVRCKFCRSQRWCKFAQYLGNDGFCSQGEYATNCGALMDKDGD